MLLKLFVEDFLLFKIGKAHFGRKTGNNGAIDEKLTHPYFEGVRSENVGAL